MNMSDKKLQKGIKRKKNGKFNKQKIGDILEIGALILIVVALLGFFAWRVDQSYFAYDRIDTIELQGLAETLSDVEQAKVEEKKDDKDKKDDNKDDKKDDNKDDKKDDNKDDNKEDKNE